MLPLSDRISPLAPAQPADAQEQAVAYDPYGGGDGYASEFEEYARLRDRCPVHLHVRAAPPAQPYPYGRGTAHPTARFWSAFRDEDARRVLRERDSFQSGGGPVADRLEFPPPGGMLVYADRPEHTVQRRIANRAFTPRRVEALAGRIRTLCDELIDAIRPLGAADIVDAVAVPLPMTVICELLGIPEDDRAHFRQWSDDAVAGFGANDDSTTHRAARGYAEYDTYIRGLIAERRAQPRGDCISDLCDADSDGRRLDDDELVALVQQLVVAGNETTRAAIGFGAELLCRHPDERDRLRRHPELAAAAVEEVLRHAPPIRGLFRTTAQDCTIGGVTIPRGEKVRAVIASANRDPARWESPDRFSIARPQEGLLGHLSFGEGVHACLGASLARLELRIALPMLVERLVDLRLDPDRPGRPQVNLLHRGWETLHVRWSP